MLIDSFLTYKFYSIFYFHILLAVSPTIFVPNQLMGAPAGKNVTLECNVEAHPRAISYWNFNNTMVLSNDKYTSTIMESSYRTNMQLTIRNLQSSDFGSYRCISKNSLGETEGSIRLYGEFKFNIYIYIFFYFIMFKVKAFFFYFNYC